MTTSAPALNRLLQCCAVVCFAAGNLPAQERAANQFPAKSAPPAALPALPAPSPALTNKGGAWYLIRVVPVKPGKVATETMEHIGDSIAGRIRHFGGELDVTVAPRGENELFVEAPGLLPKAMPAVEARILKQGRLAFHLLGPDGLQGTATIHDTVDKPGLKKLRWEDEEELPRAQKVTKQLWVQQKAALEGAVVKSAVPELQPGASSFSLHVELHPDAAKAMRALTKTNVGKPLAIVVDDTVLSVPVVMTEFGTLFLITGNFTEPEAAGLSELLAHPLDHPVTIVNSGTLPPPPKKP
jgi:preprotein translocase subunit SecD